MSFCSILYIDDPRLDQAECRRMGRMYSTPCSSSALHMYVLIYKYIGTYRVEYSTLLYMYLIILYICNPLYTCMSYQSYALVRLHSGTTCTYLYSIILYTHTGIQSRVYM